MAISNQALDASRQGEPLRPDDEVQVAGLAGEGVDLVTNLINLMRQAPKKVDEADPSKRAVPTPDEERIMGGDLRTYRNRQQEQAPKMLSPEGLQRFEEGGFSAEKSLSTRQLSPAEEAQKALEEQKPADALIDQATENLKYVDRKTGELKPGPTDKNAASEIEAAELAESIEQTRVQNFVSGSGDGLDFNFDKLQTGDDVKALFNHVSELHEPAIRDAKRGKVTNIETLDEAEQQLADEMGFTRALLKRRKGGVLNAAQMTAARKLMVRSGESLLEMANQIKANKKQNIADKELLVRFRRQMVIHSGIQMQVKSAQTEIARALQAFNIPAGASDEMRTQIVDSVLDLTAGRNMSGASLKSLTDGGVSDAELMAEALIDVHNTGGAVALHKFAATIGHKTSKVFHEAYVNGLLSWTTTHIKNFVATPLFMGWQVAEEILSGVYGSLERGAQRVAGQEVTTDGVYMGQAFARVFGMSGALRDAWVTAGQTFRTEMPTSAMNKVEAGQFRAISAESLGIDPLEHPSLSGFVDALGRGIRIPGRALMAADDFWRVIGMRGELYSEAWNSAAKAKAAGKTVTEATDDAAMTLLDPRTFTDQLDAAASYNTLTTELGALGDAARTFQRVPLIGKLMMPFVKAPTNAIIRVIERLQPFQKGVFTDPRTRQKMLGRLTLTWGAMYQFHQLAVNGRLTGAMPKDEQQRKTLPPGWQPYSLVFKGDNWPQDADGDDLPIFNTVTGAPNGPLTYINYAGLEPVGALLGIAATTAEKMRRSNDPEASLDLVANAVGAGFQYVTDMPMLTAIGDIVKAFEYNNSAYVLRSPIGGAMPYSSAVRRIEGAVDPTRRKQSKKYEYYTLEDVKDPNKVPFIKNAMGGLEPRYDLVNTVKTTGTSALTASLAELKSIATDRPLYGGADDETSGIRYDVMGVPQKTNVRFDINPVRAMWNLVMPFTISSSDELTAEMREHIRLGGPLSFEKDKLPGGINLTNAVRSQWTNFAKNEVMVVSSTTGTALKFRDHLRVLVNSMAYLQSSDKDKHNQIKSLEQDYYEAAIPLLLDKNPDLAQAMKDQQTLELLGQ